jgi:hypothetical protein
MASFIREKVFEENAQKRWAVRLEEILKAEAPPTFLSLFGSTSKQEQERLLEGSSLTPEQLAAFFFKAYTDYGFTYSKYTSEHLPEGIDDSKLPRLIHVKDGKVTTAGQTSLTEDQLKSVVSDRRVTVANFLDHGNEWHCLFTIYRSLRGEEPWQDGQPHYHYISDRWGISRDEAVNRLKSRKYPNTKVHIALLDYGGSHSE